MSSPVSPGGADLYADNPNALPVGTRLGEFELLGLLGVGGFGIVYRAFDHALEREVAVKEYMPTTLAGRTQTMHVSLRSQSDADTFALGLKSFVNEARLLARFDHPSLLKVYRFWESNGTAYMAMPILRGRTLKEVRQEMPAPPDEAWLRAVLKPLLDALEKLHGAGVYHRDIAPDNIQIEPGGRPVLLDFGAARRVISDKSQTLTAILKPAYAPIEQYAEAGAVKQGPWTDIYALGATVHYLLAKRPPAPATTRTVHDEVSALTARAFPTCSATFLRVIDWMLAPRPNDRPQSVAELRAVLDSGVEPPVWRKHDVAEDEMSEDTVILSQARGSSFDKTAMLPPSRVVVAPPPAAPLVLPPQPAVAVSGGPQPAKARSRTWVLGASALAACAALGVLAVLLWQMSKSTAPAPTLTVASPAAVAPAPAPAPSAAVVAEHAADAASAGLAAAPAAVPVAADGQASAAVATLNEQPQAVVPAGTAAATSAAATVAVAAVKTPSQAPLPEIAKEPAATPAAETKPVVAKRPATAASRPAATTLSKATPAPAVARVEPTPTSGYASDPVATAPRTPTTVAGQPPVPEVAKPVALGPEQRCSGQHYFRTLVCMERECLRSENQSHPDCLKWRKSAQDGPANR